MMHGSAVTTVAQPVSEVRTTPKPAHAHAVRQELICLGMSSRGTAVYQVAPHIFIGVSAHGQLKCTCDEGKRLKPVSLNFSWAHANACRHIDRSIMDRIRTDQQFLRG